VARVRVAWRTTSAASVRKAAACQPVPVRHAALGILCHVHVTLVVAGVGRVAWKDPVGVCKSQICNVDSGYQPILMDIIVVVFATILVLVAQCGTAAAFDPHQRRQATAGDHAASQRIGVVHAFGRAV
jgi:hypothetical protein